MKRQLTALMRAGWKNASPGELFFRPEAQATCNLWETRGHETQMLRLKRRAYGAPLYLVFHRPKEVAQ